MEPFAAYPLKYSGSKAKVFAVLLSMILCTVMLFLLQLRFLKPRINSFYSFEVKDVKGRIVSLEKFKGKGEEDPIWVPRRLTRILKDASMDDDVPAEPADVLDEPTAGEDGAKMGDPVSVSEFDASPA
ncbi:hypothetical protein STEG23_006803 [Scotinomys teguina]